MFKLLKRLIWLLEASLELKEKEIYTMSALTDATAALAVSADALTAAVSKLPPPVDESAAVSSINDSKAKVDSAVATLSSLSGS